MILVVEDHPDTMMFICRFLKRNGFRTQCATGGKQALDLLRTLTPQLIILDLRMPDMDGLGVLRTLNDQPLLKKIPVIIYSTEHEKTLVEKALRLGAKAYLVKGVVGMPELLEAVCQHAQPEADFPGNNPAMAAM